MSTDKIQSKKSFSRRKFLKRGAIVLGGTIAATYLGRSPIRRYLAQTVENMDLPSMISTFQPDFWFEVLADNTVLMKSPKIEMGQGVFTGFALMAAEELEIPLSQIRVEHANTQSGPVDAIGTGGSNSTSSLWKPVREVAATMREMLKEAAAKQWGVKASDIVTQNGVMTSGTHKATYAEISKSTKEWTVPKTPALKAASSFKLIGKDVKRVDLQPKVMGKPIYGIDQSFPDMLYAVTLQSPYLGGTIKTVNTKAAAESSGVVKVIEEKDLIAVVAKTRYAAEMGLRKIEAEWNVPKKWNQADIEQIVTVGNGTKVSIQSSGSAKAILEKNPEQVFKQEYRTPLAVHAHIEPNGAIAHVEHDKATVRMGTQAPGLVRDAVAKATGLKAKQVDLEVFYSGGGFGRRNDVVQAANAATISKIMGKPIQLLNTREQEFLNSPYYRPNTHHVLQAKLSADGSVEAITHDQASPDMVLESLGGSVALSMAGADFISAGHGASILYSVKNKEVTMWQNKLPLPTGIWRSVGIFPNTFAIENFINELAHKAGKDPIAFRLGMFTDPEKVNKRYKKVLETVAEKSGWGSPKAAGIGRGVAMTNDRQTITAAVVEVAIVDNKILVKKVTHVTDPGMCINPEGIRQQVEGCIMFGISAALYEGLQIKEGQIGASTFSEYPLASLADTPEMQVVLLEGDDVPYGVGEPPLGPMAPAIADAVFDLTGKRLRTLPLRV